MRDLYHNVKVVPLLEAQDITDHTDEPSLYVDLQGFDSAMVVVNYGTVTNTDANNKVVAKLQECDADPNLNASWADVAAADMQGTFTTVDGAADDQRVDAVGYIGSKRYLRVLLDFTSAGVNPDHCPVSIEAILSVARHGPASGITPTTGASNG